MSDREYHELTEEEFLVLNENLERFIDLRYTAAIDLCDPIEIDWLYSKNAIELFYFREGFFWVPVKEHPQVQQLMKAMRL